MTKALLLRQATASLLAVVVLSACVSKQVGSTAGSPAAGSVAPTLVLEHFLSAANAAASNDAEGIRAMGRLFGTREGPLSNRESQRNVEQRMFVLANLLRHEQYQIQGEQIVPGRMDEAKRFMVELQLRNRTVVVPFTLVLSKGGQWLVEEFDAEKITGR